MVVTSTRRRSFAELAWWQARAFAGTHRRLALLLWPVFFLDLLVRWASDAVWSNEDAVLVAVGRPPKPKRMAALLAGAGLIIGALGASSLVSAVASLAAALALLVLLGWLVAATIALKRSAPAPAATKQARQNLGHLRQTHERRVIELANVARAPQGARGAGRQLMNRAAEELTAWGDLVVCIALSPWHFEYYCSSKRWTPQRGLLCRHIPESRREFGGANTSSGTTPSTQPESA